MSAGPEQQATPTPKPEEKSSSQPSSSGGGSSSSSSRSPARSSLKSMSFDEASSALSPGGGSGGWLAYKGAGDLAPGSPDAQAVARGGLEGPSAPIPAGDASAIQETTGVDVSHGRVHTGPAAQEAASTLGVEGFTMGSQVAFASPSPSRETALHEFAHVAQQTGVPGAAAQGRAGGPELTPSGDLEAEADTVAAAAMGGGKAAVSVGAAPQVSYFQGGRGRQQRQEQREQQQTTRGPDADRPTEAEVIEETHGAEISEIVRYLRGHTSDGDVHHVLEILSSWPESTITRSWPVINRLGDGNWLGDFVDNVGDEHFSRWPRECLATFKSVDRNWRWRKLIDLSSTGFLNGVSSEEAWFAYLLLMSGDSNWPSVFRQRHPEQYENMTEELPRHARQQLREARNADREQERRQEEAAARGEAMQSQEALQQGDEGGGQLAQIRRWLDDRGLFQSVDETEARQALVALAGLGGGLRSAVQTLETEGKIDKMIDALTRQDMYTDHVREFLQVLQCRPPIMALRHIEELLSTGLFDWSVSAEEARCAYYLIKSQPVSVQRRFREQDSGRWLERMERSLGDDVTMARSDEAAARGDTVLGSGYGTASTEEEAEAQQQADRQLQEGDAWASFTQVVEHLRSGDRARALTAYTTLTEADEAVRQAMVRRLDGMNLVEGLLDQLGYDYLWASGRRHITLSIIAVRDPMRSIAQMQHLMSLGLFDWAVTSEEAYLVFQLIRALPERYQTLLQEQNPTLFGDMMAELNGSQIEADDTNAYTGGEGGADRLSILDQLASPELWQAETPEQKTQLRNVLRMAIAAGHRRIAEEMAQANEAYQRHPELMAELQLGESSEMQGTNYWNEGVFQWTAETATALAQGIDALAQTDNIDIVDQLAVEGLELDEVQDAMGGNVAGVTFARTDGDQDHINAMDINVDAIGGALHVAAEQLAIESINYQAAGMTVQTGAGTVTGLLVDATFPTSQRPDQPTTFLLRIPAVEFNDIMVMQQGQMAAIQRAAVTDVEIRMAELPVDPATMEGDGRGAAILAALQPQDALLNQIIAAAGVAGDAGDIMGEALGGYGGMEFSLGALQIDGVTTSSGVQVDHVALENVAVSLERLPSRAAERRIAAHERRIEANQARLDELAGQQERTEVDEHEVQRLTAENEQLRAAIGETRGQLPEMQQREARFLELYAIQRRGDDLGDATDEFLRLRDEFTLQVTAEMGSLEIQGAGMGGQGSGRVRVENVSASGGANVLDQAMGAGYLAQGLAGHVDTQAGLPGSGGAAPYSGNLELRAGRIVAEDVSAAGTIPDYAGMQARLDALVSKEGNLGEQEQGELATLREQFATLVGEGRTFGQVVRRLLEIDAMGVNGLTRGADGDEAEASAELLTERHRLRELLRANATTVERIDLRGVRLSGSGNAVTGGDQTTGAGAMALELGEMQIDNVRRGDLSVEQVTGTGLAVSGVGALGQLAEGDVQSGLTVGASVESLTVTNVDDRSSGLHVGSVALRDASVNATTEGDGSASLEVGSLRVADVTQQTRLAMVIEQITALEALEGGRNPAQEQQLERLRTERAELEAQGESAQTVTHVDDLSMGGFSTNVSGFGNPLEEGWSPTGRDYTIQIGLESLHIGGVSHTDGSMSVSLDAADLTGFAVDATVGVNETEDGYEVRPGSILRNARVGSLTATNLVVTKPMTNEESGLTENVRIEMPSASIAGLSASEIPLDNFDPMTMTGQVQLDSMQVGLQARIGDYFEAGGSMSMTDLSLGAVSNGDVSFHLGDLSFRDLGFSQTGEVPEGSMVAALQGMGGRVDRLEGITADATLNRQSGAVTFSAGLGTFQMSGLNYAGGGHVARAGDVTLTGASLSGTAQLDMDAIAAGTADASALQSLRVDRFHIDRVSASGIHYENAEYAAVVDLANGYLADITVTDYDFHTGGFNLDLGSGGLTGAAVRVQQQLEEGGGQRIIEANATASFNTLHVGRASDGSFDFGLDRAGLDSFRAHVEQTGSDASSITIGGSAQLTDMSGSMGADGSVEGRIGGGNVAVNGSYSSGDTQANVAVRGDMTNLHGGRRADGTITGGLGDSNLHVTGDVTTGDHTARLDYDLSGFGADAQVNPDGSFEASLHINSTGVSDVSYLGMGAYVEMGSGRLHDITARVHGRVTGEGDNKVVDVTLDSFSIPTAAVRGLTVRYNDATVTLPSATLRGFEVTDLHARSTAAGNVVDRGHAGIASIDVNALSLSVGESIDAHADMHAGGLTFDVEADGEYAFGMREAGFSAAGGYVDQFRLNGLASANVTGVSGTHGADGTHVEVQEGEFALRADGDAERINLPGSEGTPAPSAEEWAQRTLLSWELPFLDDLAGTVGFTIPIRNSSVTVQAVVTDGHIDAERTAQTNVPVPEGMWGWAPQHLGSQVVRFVILKLAEWADGKLGTLRETLEAKLNGNPNASVPTAQGPSDGFAIDVDELAALAVDEMGAAGLAIDVGTRGGRGILRTIGDEIVDFGLAHGDIFGLTDADEELLEQRNASQRAQRIEAFKDWVGQIHADLDFAASGLVRCTNLRSGQEVLSAQARATFTGSGSLAQNIALALGVNVSSVQAQVGAATVGVDNIQLNTTVGGGVDGRRMNAGAGVRGNFSGATIDIPSGGGAGS